MDKINVLVTSVGGRSVGFHVMRSLLLEPDKFNVVVTDMNKNAAGLYYSKRGYVIPPATADNYLEELIKIIKTDQIDIIIPGSEPELFALSDLRDQVLPYAKLLINPKEAIDICRDKDVMYHWLHDHGYKVPRTSCFDDVRDLVNAVGYPIVAKPTRKTGGSRNVKLLATEEEVVAYVLDHGTNDIVFQEYVGNPYREYTVGVANYLPGNPVRSDSIVMHRILDDISLLEHRTIKGTEYALSTGLSQVITTRYGYLRQVCEDICKDMGMIGPGNVQLRLNFERESGTYVYIFEVHARFSGTAYMRASVGFNDSAAMVLNFMGEPIPERMSYRRAVILKYLDQVIVPVEEYL